MLQMLHYFEDDMAHTKTFRSRTISIRNEHNKIINFKTNIKSINFKHFKLLLYKQSNKML